MNNQHCKFILEIVFQKNKYLLHASSIVIGYHSDSSYERQRNQRLCRNQAFRRFQHLKHQTITKSVEVKEIAFVQLLTKL